MPKTRFSLGRNRGCFARSLTPALRAANRASPPRAITSFIWAGVLVLGSGHAYAQTGSNQVSAPGQAIPGTSRPNDYASSVPSKAVPGVMPLSLQDAIDRGLKQNLGLLLSHADILSARGQRWEQLSSLLPHVTANPFVEESKINIDEAGICRPGKRLPSLCSRWAVFVLRCARQSCSIAV